MDSTQILITFGIAICAIALYFGALAGIQKALAKNMNVGQVLNTTDAVIDGAATLEKLAEPLIPMPARNVVDRVLQLAQTGTHKAQQLYLSGQLPPDLRKEDAAQTALNLLKLEGREITPELEAAVRDAVEAAVFIMKAGTGQLKPSPDPAPAEPGAPAAE